MDVAKGNEILVDYGNYYSTRNFVRKETVPLLPQFQYAKILHGKKPVGVARHACTVCKKILLAAKDRSNHIRHKETQCNKKIKQPYELKFLK